MKRKTFMEYL